jgi:hypothetical protein
MYLLSKFPVPYFMGIKIHLHFIKLVREKLFSVPIFNNFCQISPASSTKYQNSIHCLSCIDHSDKRTHFFPCPFLFRFILRLRFRTTGKIQLQDSNLYRYSRITRLRSELSFIS